MAFFGTLLAFSGPKAVRADQIASSKFRGLNNQGNSVTINPSDAQDLLNVDVSITGQSFKKRSGYGIYKGLGTSKGLHGGYHAFDTTGNDYQLWGSSTSLYGIVGGATPTQLISSATLNSTWDCADTQGSSYCVDSNRDAYIKTSGATINWYTSPLGTMVESTPDRVVVAGVSGSPNTLFVSQSNTFTNFVVGPLATDAFNEVIASPGSKLTHIRWGCGKLLWWKDQSFGYFDFDDQFAAQVKTVSDTIGTFDNTSAIDPAGRVWFRGQDGHTWMYDCSILTKQTIEITPDVQVTGKRVSNLWTQTTQSDFANGSIVPTANLSTSLSAGDVVVSSFYVVENSSTQWTNGTNSNMTVNSSSISLSTNNSGNVTNPDFESATSGNWVSVGSNQWNRVASTALNCGALTAESGGWYGGIFAGGVTVITAADFSALDLNNNVLSAISIPVSGSGDCTWRQLTLPLSSAGTRVKFRFRENDTNNGNSTFTTSDSYIWGGVVTFWYAHNFQTSGTIPFLAVDNVQLGSSTITSGSFTSQIYNTGFTSTTYQLQSGFTANTNTPTFNLQTSSSSLGPWATLLTSTGTNATGNQYSFYSTTITVESGSSLSYISSITVISKSTGTYYSAVKNAPNLTGWSTLGVNTVNNSGTQTFYMRSDTNTIAVLQSTPAWTATSAGSLISIATGTYFQFRDDFAVTAATQAPTLNDFTINWFEGSASDQAYMIYFDNAIWETVPFGVGQAANNYIFKYDLINEGWTLYNFGAGGLLVQSNALYFGDTSTGANVFNYGTSTSDNGSAINAFWKTKTFTGNDPFLQNSLTNIDTFAKKDQGTTLTATYTLDTLNSTSYSISLSTSASILQNRKLLPAGKLGYGFSLQLGDTSASSAWEVFGFRIGYLPQPYRPSVP